ncbi:sensor histidine kinase [Pseudomonas aeruginosa]|uniref:sensor histidine kinase n=1 Tax=Pseudomonas aeruginosa TaxID=287 RepID=UPI000F822763|nr:sensor histidine kinase [Pseudomonas aeruginosa]MBW8455510.1 ATP-binding protein [Pseudomonas sp.]MBH4102395.1 sensor histidine kinase [Pseudomonas aeruginosa]RTV59316.1 sensor histidine kinase [Pseudomonas aeruginosa]HCF3907969.1 sensor histidine kinase [Pseudomonas aeruginosa]HEJ2731285.1 sensor histidine kinase [Pseudomonas aeruginosa]
MDVNKLQKEFLDGSKESIRYELSQELLNSSFDYDKVLSLATELAKYDQENVRFSVDASHISRLGHELVSKQETAVAELIKNAYDADATYVKVVFRNHTSAGGDLVILDNGLGMGRENLINGFMRISTQDKSDNPRSTLYRRQRAGRKGIGRFSAQRLGNNLEVLTRDEVSEKGLGINIDWGKFAKTGDLILISSHIRHVEGLPVGTQLHISGLKDSWSNSQIQRAYRYISDLIQPFPLIYSPKKNKKDPGFKVEFYEELGGIEYLVASEQKSILDNALAVISGHVDKKGRPFVSLKCERHEIHISDESMAFDPRTTNIYGHEFESYSSLAGVSFTAYYFIADELPAGSKRIVKNVLKSSGGVRIYRNGFRVLPYGEHHDDWLGLQRSSALRQILPPHHNSNFIGFVQINDVDGVNFEETASREGLIENLAFSQLQDFVYRALAQGVIKIAAARGRKIFASDESPPKKPIDTADQLVKKLNGLIQLINSGVNLSLDLGEHAQVSEAAKELVERVRELGESSQALLEENGMLRVLATLGLTIGEFTHETRHVLLAISSGVLEVAEQEPGNKTFKNLKENIDSLQAYLRYFDRAVTQNTQRTLEVHEIRDVVSDFREVIGPTLKRQKAILDVQFNGYDLFVKPSHRSEWTSILLNLFTNSLKAINRAKVPGRILIRGGESEENSIYIEFIDNGDGIPDDHKERVFDAFFTTSTPADALADEEVQITGSGLGLKIIRDIIVSAGGEIFVSSPPDNYSTCIRIEFPRASEEEIPDDLR